jgi:hypothetical protein
MFTRGFHKADCESCGKKTWRYAQSDCNVLPECTHGKVRTLQSNVIPPPVGKDYTPVPHPPLERVIKHVGTVLDAEDTEAIFGKTRHTVTPHDLCKLRCSYCGTDVDHILATEANTKSEIGTVHETVQIGNRVEYREKLIHKSGRVVACPACVGNVKAITDKHGDLISSGVRIPNTD